jgi:nucleoside-diphosphate-sugar epimerase
VLDLAELAQRRGGLERYAHVSTAYIAGTHGGRFRESDYDVSQGFRNAYEQSKFEAEKLVRCRDYLPTTILRPSIVVGDRRSGWTSAFNVLYWPLRAFARGLYRALPAIPLSPVDVVSVDFVADAIYVLCRDAASVGRTYHLTAGAHSSSVAELVALASSYFERPPPRVLPPAEFDEYIKQASRSERSMLRRSAAYFPYFALTTEFDNARDRGPRPGRGDRLAYAADQDLSRADRQLGARTGPQRPYGVYPVAPGCPAASLTSRGGGRPRGRVREC